MTNACGSPILMISTYEYVEYVNGNMVASCLTPVENFWHAAFFVGSIVVFFIFPLFILVVLYSVIAKNLMDNPSIIMSNASGNRSNVLKYRKQVMFMLGAVVVSFFFCLLPFRALTLWIIIVPSENIVSIGFERFYIILYFCRIMLYMNSAINPILYNLMSSKFRNGFLQLLGCGKMIRSGSMSSTVRKGTFHTASTNLSSSLNSSSQRRLTRDESSVSGRTMESNNSRKRLLHQRHNSTISIKSGNDEARDATLIGNGGSVCTPSEVVPLNADKIEELDESTTTAASLPNGYGFHRFKHLNGSCSVISSSTSKTSQRLNGIVSVEPITVHQPDNKYLIVRAAVIVVQDRPPGDDDPPVGSPSAEHAVVSSNGCEPLVSIITAKDENQNSNYINQGQQQHQITANGKDSVNVQSENIMPTKQCKTADGQESLEEHPYEGPFQVIKRHEKFMDVLINGQKRRITIDRIKPAYVCNQESDEDDGRTKVTPSGHRVRFLA
ncbi:conserved hypothetical protein [Culex quinquefasciatus]|uniref:Thyrotropin-releasing hormone receptor n=1 Tax=Culex quinquefasciatus TaxID=7176 RepID=B0W906_CULQU|nr:conserved hypothetical protein [Culex quinquefasciatus]|eukprot:XP_001845190.1 conserved hypothetical protein [Culex quinquefasciatus]